MRIAVIGCGYWGRNLTRNLSELGVLAAVCDANTENALAVSEQYGVPTLKLHELLNSEIDAAVIAAPSPQHYSLTKQVLLSGKHVFVEKPFTLKLSEALELHELSLKHNCKIMVGHLLQYHPGFLTLQNLVVNGDLGKIGYISCNRLNFGHFKYDENILWDFAPHDVSMALSLTKSIPDAVFATGSCLVEPGSHDTVNLNLMFKDELQVQIYVSRMHPYKEQKLVVVGEQGMAVFNDGLPWDQKLKIYPHRVAQKSGIPMAMLADPIQVEVVPAEPLKIECQKFIDWIDADQVPRSDSTEAVEVVRVLHAAQQSLQLREKVTIKHTQIVQENLNEKAFG